MEELVLKVIKQNVVVNTLGAKDAIKQVLNALWLKNMHKGAVAILITQTEPDLADMKIKYNNDFDNKFDYKYIVENIPTQCGYIDTTKIMNIYI